MKISEAFPSKYLKAADLQGRRITATIDQVEMANIGDDTDKMVVYFVGKEKGFVLNRTNANMIAEIAKSEETEDWHGVKIVIFPTRVDFQGRRVDAIRVDYPAQSNGHAERPLATPVQQPAREREVGDDDIPW